MTPIVVEIPGLQLVSEANRASHEHWRERQGRAKMQLKTAYLHTLGAIGRQAVTFPLIVTITRISPRELDWDNAVGSAKATIDAVAKALRIDDRDKRVTWDVKQEKGPSAVRIRIEAREEVAKLAEGAGR